MDLKRTQPLFLKKEQKFKQRLAHILSSEDLTLQRQLILKVVAELKVEPLDCAAALVFLNQANLYQIPKVIPEAELSLPEPVQEKPQLLKPMPEPKMERYRIDIGQKHQTSVEELKSVFVAEAGVDIKTIGEVDIRQYYTIIELPEGMPGDIYRLLSTVSIRQQKLNIKRLKPHTAKPQQRWQKRKTPPRTNSLS